VPAPAALQPALEAAFWAAGTVVFYSYAGYPALVALLGRGRPEPHPEPPAVPPRVSVLIAARNEAEHIGAKLESCLALAHPGDRLEVLVVSDASDDGTDAIVRDFASRGVRLLRLEQPSGKAVALNRGVAASTGEILLFTDARQPLEREALAALLGHFSEPTTGAVSGELMIASAPGQPTRGVGLYWRYEKWIRRAESRLDSTVGVTGALYALRRELFEPLDPRLILDDVAIPMAVVLRGKRVLFEPGARAWDRLPDRPGQEYRRKLRTLAGNFQLLRLQPRLLDPRRNRLLWQLVSHKLTRLLVPWCLLALLLATAALATTPRLAWRLALGLQLAFYAAAALGAALAARGRALGPLSAPFAFVLLNLAAGHALVRFLRGRERGPWKSAP
jgi:cellulose synthase/poly-beta-1,6-N-acetylglucosamine synthase-like glycosyltransferase